MKVTHAYSSKMQSDLMDLGLNVSSTWATAFSLRNLRNSHDMHFSSSSVYCFCLKNALRMKMAVADSDALFLGILELFDISVYSL